MSGYTVKRTCGSKVSPHKTPDYRLQQSNDAPPTQMSTKEASWCVGPIYKIGLHYFVQQQARHQLLVFNYPPFISRLLFYDVLSAEGVILVVLSSCRFSFAGHRIFSLHLIYSLHCPSIGLSYCAWLRVRTFYIV